MVRDRILRLKDCHCEVCGHDWISTQLVPRCALCKSREWNGKKGRRAGKAEIPEPRGVRETSI